MLKTAVFVLALIAALACSPGTITAQDAQLLSEDIEQAYQAIEQAADETVAKGACQETLDLGAAREAELDDAILAEAEQPDPVPELYRLALEKLAFLEDLEQDLRECLRGLQQVATPAGRARRGER